MVIRKAYAHTLPRILSNPLFGNREQYGFVPDQSDADWIEYVEQIDTFYLATQRGGIGEIVNNAGYKVLRDLDLSDKCVLEVGPGGFHHASEWMNLPASYLLVDLYDEYLDAASEKLEVLGVPYSKLLTKREKLGELPAADESVDLILSFFTLEHLYPLGPHLSEMHRVLKRGGQIIGAIPAEGGLGWGLGRYFTTRRWFHANTNINPDKIICWEHPNFADDVLNELGKHFIESKVEFWPLTLSSIDLNLVLKFSFTKAA